jgi:hypothetical protein
MRKFIGSEAPFRCQTSQVVEHLRGLSLGYYLPFLIPPYLFDRFWQRGGKGDLRCLNQNLQNFRIGRPGGGILFGSFYNSGDSDSD